MSSFSATCQWIRRQVIDELTCRKFWKQTRTGWLRLAEKLPTGLRRNAAGALPLDEELPKLQGDPRVVFHLMPLPVGGATKRNTEDNTDGGPESSSGAVAGVKAMGKESRCASLLPCLLSSKGNGAPLGAGFHCVGRSTQQLGVKMHPQAAAVHGVCIYVLSPTVVG